MHRFRRFSFLLIAAPVIVGAAVLAAQNADDLPAAPSEVNRPKPAQPKPAPPPQTPKPSSDGSQAAPAANAQGSTTPESDTQPSAQNEPELESGITIPVRVNEVSVVFTVTDKHNHYVKTLTRGDFKVIDDEHPVEEIRSFRRETDLPLQVGLLIDASNSIRDRFKFEQESAIEFLSQIVRPRYDKAFVIGFDVAPEVTQDFTDNTEALAKGVRALRPGGGTAMYDALYYACRDKLMKAPQTTSVRRAIILVSDGDDNESHVTREEAIEMALRANVIVYTISTNFPGGGNGDKVLERIADATGGRSFEPFQLQQVANAFAQIQDDLRSQYELSYRPENFAHDGRYRTIEVSALRKGLKVRSRNGYYAPGE
jgi:Ca-activated chloride channel homolog